MASKPSPSFSVGAASVAAFHVVWIYAEAASFDSHLTPREELWWAAFLLVGSSIQSLLLVSWITLSDRSAVDQLIQGGLVGFSLIAIYCHALMSREVDGNLTEFFAVVMVLMLVAGPWVAACMLCRIAHQFGWRWLGPTIEPGPGVAIGVSSPPALSLVAAVFSALLFRPLNTFSTLDEWAVGSFLIALGLTVLATLLIALTASIGPRIHAGFVGGTIVAAFVIGFALPRTLGGWFAREELDYLIGTANAAFAATLIGSLLMLRASGLRIDRVPSVPLANE